MSSHRDLDDFMRQKLSEREPPAFDPAYWEQAAALIEAQSPRRRVAAWWIWGGVGLLLLVLIGLWRGIGDPAALPTPADLASGSLSPETVCPPDPDLDLPQARASAGDASPGPIEQAARGDSTAQVRASAGDASPGGTRSAERSPRAPRLTRSSRPTPVVAPGEEAPAQLPPAPPTQRLAGRPDLDSVAVVPYELTMSSPRLPRGLSLLPPAGRGRRNTLYAEGGLILAPAWGSDSDLPVPSQATPMLGLGYSYSLHPRLRLRTGLRYTRRGGLASDSAYVRTRYSFGYEAEVTHIIPQYLHTLAVPLQLEWRLAGPHSVSLSLEQAWLLNVSARVREETRTETRTTPGASRLAWGYRQGFRRWNPAINLGYSRYLGTGLHLGLQARYGWRDLTDPAFFRSSRRDRDIRLNFILTYDLTNF